MEGFLIVGLILGFIITNSNINSKIKGLETKILGLNQQIKQLQQKIATQKSTRTLQNIQEKTTVSPTVSVPKESIKITPISEDQKVAPILTDKVVTPKQVTPATQKKTLVAKQPTPKKVSIPKKPWWQTFKEKNPDLEKFIGENLINKIGILILVLGISFFVKYAIDKDWINEPARVGIGILAGSLVMFVAHKLKKNYASFSSVLIAGAISIFYFTIYIAFHEYQLFSQTVAFSIMAVITAFSTLVSVSYNRQELAVLSLIGGFAAPFLVSTGEGNYVVLFTYIVILNLGILSVSYFKKWKIATILSFIFTTLLFAVWCTSKIWDQTLSHLGALAFATIFYFIFSITIVLSNLRNKGVFSKIEYFILVANTFFFFGIGMAILGDWESNFTGLFTLLLAVYNVLYAGVLYKKFGLDKNAVYLLIGLALTFVTLTIPIQFKGNLITIFWAAEVVLLFWLSQKSKISSFKLGAVVVQVLTVISLLLDWKGYSFTSELNVALNPLFISGVMVSISFFLTYWLSKKENNISNKFFTIDIKIYRIVLLIVGTIVTYLTGILEINYQAFQFLENEISATSIPVTYHYIFVAILLYLATKFNKANSVKVVLGISVVSILGYILWFYKMPKNEIIENYVYTINTHYAFYFHYIILACLVYFGYQLLKKTSELFNIRPKQSKWLPWVFAFAIVYVLSNEIMIHGLHFSNSIDVVEMNTQYPSIEDSAYQKQNYVTTSLNRIQTQIIKIGYPILWGVFSFVFLIIGIKKQWKVLRIIALSLLGLTIVKLFAYDIKNVSETGKIIAFILLGVLILVISFVYQKIKKLVVDETTEKNTEDEKI